MKYLFSILCLSLFFIGCNNNTLDEETFSNVYTELIIAEDTSSLKPVEFRKIVFDKFKVTEENYYKTVETYKASPEKWEAFFNKTIENLEKRKGKPVKN